MSRLSVVAEKNRGTEDLGKRSGSHGLGRLGILVFPDELVLALLSSSHQALLSDILHSVLIIGNFKIKRGMGSHAV